MRYFILAAALASWPALAQTNCAVVGNQVFCNDLSLPAPSYSTPQVPYGSLLNSGRDVGNAFADGQARYRSETASAYDNVAQLVGQGRCADAMRVARLYGDRQLISATERACR